MADRIDPISPRRPAPAPIPSIRRSDGSDEERERDPSQPRKRRPPPPPEPPPDDGLPHIDVRV